MLNTEHLKAELAKLPTFRLDDSGQLYAACDSLRLGTTHDGFTRVEFVLGDKVVSTHTFTQRVEPIDVQVLGFNMRHAFLPISMDAIP